MTTTQEPEKSGRCMKKQRTEKAVKVVAELLELNPLEIIGKMNHLPHYKTARTLLVQVFVDDIGLKDSTIQKLFDYVGEGAVRQSYKLGKNTIAHNPKLTKTLRAVRRELNSN